MVLQNWGCLVKHKLQIRGLILLFKSRDARPPTFLTKFLSLSLLNLVCKSIVLLAKENLLQPQNAEMLPTGLEPGL